jgi:UDPglucose 6-dehydrogenase
MQAQAISRISVFGLGKLGAVISACWASRGFEVVGVDVNAQTVDQVRRGIAPVREPQLDELFEEAGSRLSATGDAEQAVRDTQATLLVVPTPSHSDGGYSNEFVLRGCEQIGRALRDKSDYHLVVLKSTVLPGSCDREIIPALERASGRRAGRDFGFCYNPEFIALGTVVRNLLQPDFLLIGEADARAGDALVEAHSRMLGRPVPMPRMSCSNAELAKLAVNSYVTMKITFANLIAQLCEELPGGSAAVVSDAIGLDSRIGRKYLTGGLGFGGPCFPRDNAALLCLAERLGVPFPLAAATDRANRALAERVAAKIAAQTPPGARIGVLGLSYKPDTPVVEESQGVLIAGLLAGRGLAVTVYDPLALEGARALLGERVRYARSLEECLEGADAVAITTPWEQFRDLPVEKLSPQGPRLVFDCWNIAGAIRPGVARRRVLGQGPGADAER